jgi:hypothetical protein
VGHRVTICPRGKKGIYTAEFWWDGHHRRVSLKTSNKKVAVQRAIRLEADLEGGSYGRTQIKKSTIAQAVEDYLRYLKTEGRRTKTLVKYRGVLETFAGFATAERAKYLNQITATLFDKFQALRKKDHSQKSLYNEAVIIKSLWQN